MMDVPNFRSYAFIKWRMGKTATETFEDLSTTFPDLSPGRSTVLGWVEAMKKGSFTLEKGTSSGRPKETRTPENISRVRELQGTSRPPPLGGHCPPLEKFLPPLG